MLSRQQAAALLKEYSILLDLTEDDGFRSKTFANAARQLEVQTQSLDELIGTGSIAQVRGIGKTVMAAIEQIAATESFAELEKARGLVPAGVLELLRVEGLGPKKAKALWKEAAITSLDELETAIREGTLPKLSGFGAKTLEKFLEGIAFIRRQSGRHLRNNAVHEADYFRKVCSALDGVQEVCFGGSLRRGCETIGDLDVVLIAEPTKIDSLRTGALAIREILWSEGRERVLCGRTMNSFDIELSVCAPEEAPHRKLLATGSKEHLQELRRIAEQRGLQLTNDGLRNSAGRPIELETEDDLYRALELEPVPAPLREAGLKLLRLNEGQYPRPVQLSDFRGILHNHTTASDGHNSLREMAEAMIAGGYEFLGIADHSQVAAYANGLTPARVREQWQAIDELNRELAPFRILKGTEVDILPDGAVDFDDELLAGFDYVVASIHSGFNMTEEAATERLCRALENPHVDILGHPTGRLLLKRDGYPVNHERLIDCAAANGKAIELNANPYRLDIDWRRLRLCIEREVPVPINPDAHSIDGLSDIRYGVDVAAKGPLTPALCPSCWSADKFLEWCNQHERR